MLVLSLFFLYSCEEEKLQVVETQQQEEATTANPTITENATYYFELDGKPVEEGAFDMEDESLYILVTDRADENEKNVFVIRAFSSREAYVQFGEENDIPIALGLEIEEHLAKYAEESGAIAHEEKTGEVPEFYLQYMNEYLGNTGRSAIKRATIFNDNCMGTGTGPLNNAFTLIGTKPKLSYPFNDNVEKFRNAPFAVYVLHKVYTKTFFRKKIFQMWLNPTDEICFEGPLADRANRASSWLCIL